jgi:hypothetical protein
MLILTFTVFIFKAGFFQAQLLFFFLNFCLFLLMLRLLKKPSWSVAVLTGIVAGLSHLTKASILPGLVIFLASFGIDWLLAFVRRDPLEFRALIREKSFYYQPICALLVVLVFLAVVFPYVSSSKRLFGQYFYNVNSTFYLWYDSWEEAKQGTAAHGDRVGWPDMPADEIPSMSKYLRERSARQIFDRFLNGGILITDMAAHSYGYFKYFAIYAFALIVTMVRYRERTLQIIRSNLALSIFLLTYFTTYFWLYAWFSPMLRGANRLVLAQFLPLMFTMSVWLHRLLSDSKTTVLSFQFNTLTLINLAVLVVLIFNIHFILTERISSMYGGF